MRLRPATPSDLNCLIDLRMAFLAEARPGKDIPPTLKDATRRHFESRLGTDPTFICHVAEIQGAVVATCLVILWQRLPSLSNPSGQEGYLCNVFTSPAVRRRGIAAALVRSTVDAAVATGATKIWLYALPSAEAIYARAGFSAAAHNAIEMEWKRGD